MSVSSEHESYNDEPIVSSEHSKYDVDIIHQHKLTHMHSPHRKFRLRIDTTITETLANNRATHPVEFTKAEGTLSELLDNTSCNTLGSPLHQDSNSRSASSTRSDANRAGELLEKLKIEDDKMEWPDRWGAVQLDGNKYIMLPQDVWYTILDTARTESTKDMAKSSGRN